MDEQKIEFINSVIDIFDNREKTYLVYTQQIVQRLQPTVLEALYDFFEVSYEAITWLEFQLDGAFLTIAAVVTYGGDQKTPEIIERLAPIAPLPPDKKVAEIRRMIRIGLPIEQLGNTKEQIVEYLKEQTAKQPTPEQPLETVEEVEPPTAQTEYSQLNKEQLEQVLFFQQQTKGTKH